MRKRILILFLLLPGIAYAQASFDVINVNYKADNLNFTTGNGSKFFNLVLTGNVNTSGLNGGSLGMEVIFNICQDNVGGRTFNWPPNVINPPPINSAALACTSTRFVNIGNFQWTNTGNANGTGAGTPAAGSPPQTQVNDPGNPGHFGGTPCENFPSLTVGPINADCDWHSKGPNPYVDITRFGARTCAPLSAPCASGITASINSGSATATLSSASTFINGDGIVIYGAGPVASVSSAPTGLVITNVAATVGTGTGISVTSAAGASTRCYKVIARDTGGGYTPASSEVCNNTSLATLGAITVNLTSCSRSGIVVTCTAASAIPLLVGAPLQNAGEVFIGGNLTDGSFRGWRDVTTVTDSTHFTFQDNATNTGNGASTNVTGGTATFYVANHVTWNAVANAWLYYVYEGASGAETLIGVSRPQGAVAGITDTTFDDFGTPFTSNITFPAWIPTTPPSVGANDNLSTTIVSGAGTTTIILASTAGATVAGVGIRLDAGVGIKAAAAVANNFSELYIPADNTGNFFVVNNFCDLTSGRLSIRQTGTLYLHETIALAGSGMRWQGDRGTATGVNGGGGTNNWGTYPKINVIEAVPGVYINSGFGYSFEGLDIQGITQTGNGVLDVLAENGFNASFKDVRFVTGIGGSFDYMGFGLYLRGNPSGQSAAGIVMDKVSFSGGVTTDGSSHNTPFFCNNCGDLRIRIAYVAGRGIIYVPLASQGPGQLRIEDVHYNGGFSPLVTVGAGNTTVVLGQPGQTIIMDTAPHPCVSSLNGLAWVYNNGCAPVGAAATPSVTGQVFFDTGGISSQTGNGFGVGQFNNSLTVSFIAANQEQTNTPVTVLSEIGPGGISVGYNQDSIFVQGPPPAAPTCSVSAGGSVPLGTWTFKIQPVWWSGLEGTASPASTGCTTTTGNQTITVNWTTTVGGGPKGFNVFTSNGGGYTSCGPCIASNPFPPSTTSLVWSTNQFGSPNLGLIPLAGPSMLLPANQGIVAPALVVPSTGATQGFTSTITGNFSANRAVSLPDFSGLAIVSSYQNSAYDNFNRAGPGLGSNWTTTATTTAPTISGNQIAGQASNSGAFWNAATFSPDQFAEAVVVTPSAGGVAAVAVRGSLTAWTDYIYDCTTTSRAIAKFVSGAFTSLVSTGTGCAAGDVLRLEVQGTTLNGFRNGVLDLTTTDSSIASGFPGFQTGPSALIVMDNWSGGNLHPIAQLDQEQDWTQPQHFIQPVTIGPTNPVAGALAANTLYIPNTANSVTGNLSWSGTNPTIGTHFNTSGDSISANGVSAFTITVGTGAATNTGAIVLPTAANGWNCWLTNQARADLIQQTSSGPTTATFSNFGTTFALTNWTNGDILRGGCAPL